MLTCVVVVCIPQAMDVRRTARCRNQQFMSTTRINELTFLINDFGNCGIGGRGKVEPVSIHHELGIWQSQPGSRYAEGLFTDLPARRSEHSALQMWGVGIAILRVNENSRGPQAVTEPAIRADICGNSRVRAVKRCELVPRAVCVRADKEDTPGVQCKRCVPEYRREPNSAAD